MTMLTRDDASPPRWVLQVCEAFSVEAMFLSRCVETLATALVTCCSWSNLGLVFERKIGHRGNAPFWL